MANAGKSYPIQHPASVFFPTVKSHSAALYSNLDNFALKLLSLRMITDSGQVAQFSYVSPPDVSYTSTYPQLG